ncbi:GIY-YIG nuclease family protein [Clostridium botulinum]|uniref:GIY-YIG nuclease family protein n=1 Tax=Clostridium botulinum TaxID=1491 RepID=UPI001748967A|nr:GIY-YIG nuclease family protein [Clostridium botulinum]MBD5589174.1 GIY-YIG nuclease family protein [Clostridium botulinum]
MSKITKKELDTLAKKILHLERYKVFKKEDSVTFTEYVLPCKKSIYVMKDQFNRIKIGISNNPEERSKAFSTSGLKIDVKYYTDLCSNSSKIESNLHKVFADRKIKGEWFNITEKEAIKEIQKQTLENKDYILKDDGITFNNDEIYRLLKINGYVDIEELLDNNRFLLRATKNELIEKIKYLFMNEEATEEYYCTEYPLLNDTLMVYFNIFDEDKLNIFDFTIEYEPHGIYCSFYVLKGEYYNDLELTIPLFRENNRDVIKAMMKEVDMLYNNLLGENVQKCTKLLSIRYKNNDYRDKLQIKGKKAFNEIQSLNASLMASNLDFDIRKTIICNTCKAKFKDLKNDIKEEFLNKII